MNPFKVVKVAATFKLRDVSVSLEINSNATVAWGLVPHRL